MSSPTDVDLRFHAGPWTEADYLELSEDRARIELLDGGLLVNPAPGTRHQRLSSRLWLALDGACPAGMEILEAVNVRVAPGRILIPDLVAVTTPGVDREVVDADDVALAVEIVSPGSVAVDRAVKPPLYAAAGIGAYARIELQPGSPRAWTFRLDRGVYVPAVDAAPDGMLRLASPFVAEVDLAALLSATRSEARREEA